jgi:SAM-dependent methyltransferase
MSSPQLTYTGADVLETLNRATNYNSVLLDLILESSGDCCRMLDFGAGIGTFAKLLRSRDVEVVCVEPDVLLAAGLVRDGFVTVNDLNEIADGSFDFVFTLNVLEHIEDDQTSLCRLATKLARGGRLLIYVPAFRCLWTSLDERVKHYRRYRRAGLERLARSVGLSVCKTRYVDSLGFFAALAFRIFGNKNGHLSARAVSLYDRCIVPLSRLVDLLAGRLFGKNVYLIAAKDYQSSAVPVEPQEIGHSRLHSGI